MAVLAGGGVLPSTLHLAPIERAPQVSVDWHALPRIGQRKAPFETDEVLPQRNRKYSIKSWADFARTFCTANFRQTCLRAMNNGFGRFFYSLKDWKALPCFCSLLDLENCFFFENSWKLDFGKFDQERKSIMINIRTSNKHVLTCCVKKK